MMTFVKRSANCSSYNVNQFDVSVLDLLIDTKEFSVNELIPAFESDLRINGRHDDRLVVFVYGNGVTSVAKFSYIEATHLR